MAAGGAFGGGRGLQPTPPEKGVFPLDHLEECKPARALSLSLSLSLSQCLPTVIPLSRNHFFINAVARLGRSDVGSSEVQGFVAFCEESYDLFSCQFCFQSFSNPFRFWSFSWRKDIGS
jgi:hypothetical protein